jgi:O-antigen ligase
MSTSLTGSLFGDAELVLGLGIVVVLFFYATARRPVVGLAGFLFLVLTRAHEYFPQLERLRPSVVIGMIMLAGLFAHLWRKRQPLAFGKPHALILLAYIGICWLSLLVQGRSYYDLNGKLLIEPLLLVLVSFFVTLNAIHDEREFRFLLLTLGAIGITIAAATLVQSFITGVMFGRGANWIYSSEEGILRRAGTLGLNPNDVAFTLAVLLPVSYWHTQSHRNSPLVRGLFALSLPLLTLTVILTLSRGGFICLIVALLLIFYRMLKAKYVIAFFLLCFGVVLFTPAAFWERLASTWTSDPTGQGRLIIYQVALNMIETNPLTGVGYGQFYFLYSSYGGKIWQSVSSHNTYLGIAAETGLPNLILFTILITMCFITISQISRQSRTGAASQMAFLLRTSLIVILLAGLTGDVSQWVLLYLIIAMTLAFKRIQSRHFEVYSSETLSSSPELVTVGGS